MKVRINFFRTMVIIMKMKVLLKMIKIIKMLINIKGFEEVSIGVIRMTIVAVRYNNKKKSITINSEI